MPTDSNSGTGEVVEPWPQDVFVATPDQIPSDDCRDFAAIECVSSELCIRACWRKSPYRPDTPVIQQ